MDSFSSGEAMKRDEPTYGQRRKFQNRLAQKRYREKARLQKHVASKSSEAGNAASNKSNEEGQPDPPSEHVLPIESDITFFWQHMSETTDENQNLSAVRSDGRDNFIRAMPGTQTLSQQVDTPPGIFQFQDPNVPVGPELCLEQNQFGTITGQVHPYKHSSQGARRSSVSDGTGSRPCPKDYEAMHEQLQHYETVIQGQKLQLYSQAGKLVEKSISLLDTGVLLGILPSNPHLRDLLRSAQAAIQSSGSTDDGE